jgi:hypothetical protein
VTVTPTYVGPPIDDADILARVPPDLSDRLRQTNGFIWFGGGLHVRGACREPIWHSLRAAWEGDAAFHALYPTVQVDDVPFAEDCMGDQFLIRGGTVWKLAAETGDVEDLGLTLADFFVAVAADPLESLGMHPLVQFRKDGGTMRPDQLLAAFPPFCVKTEDEYNLRPVSGEERRRFLADFAAQIRDLPDGATIEFKIINSGTK